MGAAVVFHLKASGLEGFPFGVSAGDSHTSKTTHNFKIHI